MNCCVGLFFYLFILCIYYTKKFLQNQAAGPQKLRIKLNFKLTSYAPAFNLAICYLALSYLDPNSIFRGYEPLSISYSFALMRSFTHNQSFAFHRLSAALGTARYSIKNKI